MPSSNITNIQNNIAYLLSRCDKDMKEMSEILHIVDSNYKDEGIIESVTGGVAYSNPEFIKKPEELKELVRKAEQINSRIKENAALVDSYVRALPSFTISDSEIDDLRAKI